MAAAAPAVRGLAALRGKTALVTGSTSGIGLATAQVLAGHGMHVALNGFGAEEDIADAVAQLQRDHGVDVTFHGADLRHRAAIRDMFRHVEDVLGPVDVLVNNAGVQHVASLEEFPEHKWNFVLDVNLNAVQTTTAMAINGGMRERGYGRIINVASVHGLKASVNKSAYVTAKHGVVGMTKAVALELAGTGITCNAICPGWVLTKLVLDQIELRAKESGRSVEEETHELLREKQPSEQFVRPEDVGELVAFLCTPAGDQITGSSISIDGGWAAR